MRFFPRKIRESLILAFTVLISLSTGLIGLILYWQTEENLERDLSDKLIAIGQLSVSQINPDLILSLSAGDETTRTYSNLKSRLEKTLEQTQVKKIYIFSHEGENIIDTGGMSIGEENVRLRFFKSELDKVFSGEGVASVLFQDEGDYYKSGFVPIWKNDRIVAAMGVDASAAYVKTLRNFRRQAILFVFLVIGLTTIFSVYFSKSVTDPITKLVNAARILGKGDFSKEIEIRSHTELRYLGEAMESMREGIIKRDENLKLMLAGIAHEVKNPLGSIEIFADLLNVRLPPGSKEKDYLARIVEETRNLNSVINDFLKFARPLETKREKIELSELLQEIYDLLVYQIEDKKINFSNQFGAQSVFVAADREQIRTVFVNILKNAIDAVSGDGGGKISVEYSRSEQMVELRVTDNGTGIEGEDVIKIFDPFFTTKEQGTGLGLAVAKKILDSMGGAIQVECDESTGTTFVVKLPQVILEN